MEVLLLVVFVGSLGFAVYQIAGLINPVGTSITLEEAATYNALHNPKIPGMQGLSSQIEKAMFAPILPTFEFSKKKDYDNLTNKDPVFERFKESSNETMEVPDFAKEEEQISKIRKLTTKQKKTIQKLIKKLSVGSADSKLLDRVGARTFIKSSKRKTKKLVRKTRRKK